ncbi:hypothetical protein BC938DRAFT_474648 [Jimgerdemannia flammicorona]|uniref:ACT domain-containing protein n=1 Tax=Jimgerdemannia flammicorona TaxID=994334 RepID=A0A433Q1T1_9FUNG|nr:hypothetical protein BC938DRAFT_474648 [Jimgerdemannia flammicorona]
MSISLLPVSLRLVSVPKPAHALLAHPVIRNIFFDRPAHLSKSPGFFSITENQLEVTIIVDKDSANDDFAPLIPLCPGMVISDHVFTALQVDDDYGMEYSGRRIHDLSAALTEASISILYISTYQTDFILVKEKRLPLVIATLEQANFSVSQPDVDLPPHNHHHHNHTIPTTSTRSPIDISRKSHARGHGVYDPFSDGLPVSASIDRLHKYSSSWNSMSSHSSDDILRDDPEDASPFFGMGDGAAGFVKGHAEAERVVIGEVRRNVRKTVPENDLRLVGLNRDYIETWSISLIQALFYPETPHSCSDSLSLQRPTAARFISFTQFEEGVSLICDAALLRGFPEHVINTFVQPLSIKCIQMDLTRYGLDKYGVVYTVSDPLVTRGINLLYLSTYRTANVLIKSEDLQQSLSIFDALESEHQRAAAAAAAAAAGLASKADAAEMLERELILLEE